MRLRLPDAAEIFTRVKRAFTQDGGGTLPEEAAAAMATGILGGANVLVVGSEVAGLPRAGQVAARAIGLFEPDCGPSVVLTEILAASLGGEITGGPTTTVQKETLVDGDVVETSTQSRHQPSAIPLDVGLLVLSDVTQLDRSALVMMEYILGPEFGGRPRSMNSWGRMVDMPNLRSVVAVADGERLVEANLSSSFRYLIDIVVDVSADLAEQVGYLNSELERAGDPATEDTWGLDDAPIGPPLLDASYLRTFDSAMGSVESPDEAFAPHDEALLAYADHANFADQGVLRRLYNVAVARAAGLGRTELSADDVGWALRTRSAAYTALTGTEVPPPPL